MKDYKKIVERLLANHKNIKYENNTYLCEDNLLYIDGHQIKNRGDCTTRAIAEMVDKSWQKIFDMQLKYAKLWNVFPNSIRITRRILSDFGSVPILLKPKMQAIDIIKTAYKGKYCLMNPQHCFVVKDCVIYDDFIRNSLYQEENSEDKIFRAIHHDLTMVITNCYYLFENQI